MADAAAKALSRPAEESGPATRNRPGAAEVLEATASPAAPRNEREGVEAFVSGAPRTNAAATRRREAGAADDDTSPANSEAGRRARDVRDRRSPSPSASEEDDDLDSSASSVNHRRRRVRVVKRRRRQPPSPPPPPDRRGEGGHGRRSRDSRDSRNSRQVAMASRPADRRSPSPPPQQEWRGGRASARGHWEWWPDESWPNYWRDSNKGRQRGKGKGEDKARQQPWAQPDDQPDPAVAHAAVLCRICNKLIKGGVSALRAHQAMSSRCLAVQHPERYALEPCPRCGRNLAAGDAWARQQHSWRCVPRPGK